MIQCSLKDSLMEVSHNTHLEYYKLNGHSTTSIYHSLLYIENISIDLSPPILLRSIAYLQTPDILQTRVQYLSIFCTTGTGDCPEPPFMTYPTSSSSHKLRSQTTGLSP